MKAPPYGEAWKQREAGRGGGEESEGVRGGKGGGEESEGVYVFGIYDDVSGS